MLQISNASPTEVPTSRLAHSQNRLAMSAGLCFLRNIPWMLLAPVHEPLQEWLENVSISVRTKKKVSLDGP